MIWERTSHDMLEARDPEDYPARWLLVKVGLLWSLYHDGVRVPGWFALNEAKRYADEVQNESRRTP